MADLSSLLSINEPRKTKRVTIFALGDDDRAESAFEFQYFPETITDSKTINYSSKEVPGGSLPIKQYVSSGARTISFTTVLSTDIDTKNKNEPKGSNSILLDARGRRYNIDVANSVAYLRSFLFPTYGNAGVLGMPITKAPPKCLLQVLGSEINRAGDPDQVADAPILCVMTSCEVTWEQFFPNNLPRIATVSLSFEQIAQFNRNVFFPNRPAQTAGSPDPWNTGDGYYVRLIK